MFETSDHAPETDTAEHAPATDGDFAAWLDEAADREEHDAGARW